MSNIKSATTLKALSQAFKDHQQTAMKEFMVFDTNSVILPHIIEQALRPKRALKKNASSKWALCGQVYGWYELFFTESGDKLLLAIEF